MENNSQQPQFYLNDNNNSNNDTIVYNPRHAVLFAEYGTESEYVRKILNKLKERNIVVDNIFSPTVRKGIGQAIQSADIVLLMHEMSGHRDGIFIKDTASKLGKNVVFLPRKVSQWGNLTKTAEGKFLPSTSSRTITAVTDTNLGPFLKQYVELANTNLSHRDMLAKLAMFWEGPLGTPQQLGVMLHFLLRSDRCPEWFKLWWLENRGNLPEHKARIAATEPENEPVMGAQEAIEQVDGDDDTTEDGKEEKLLAEMYAQDSERLAKIVDSSKEKLANMIYILLKEKGIPLTEIENMFKSIYREDMSQNLYAFSMELAQKIVEENNNN